VNTFELNSRPRRNALRALGSQGLAIAMGSSLFAKPARASTARSALVIGNAAYDVAPLNNAVNDARLMTQTLQQLHFDVRSVEDATLRGENYLVPVGLRLKTEADLQKRALKLSTVVKTLSSQPQGVNFVFVDACRTDPSALFRAGSQTRAVDPDLKAGFTPPETPTGTVISFSTSPGEIAVDGRGMKNSMFTRALADQLMRPGLPVETLFKRVRVQVMRATQNAQVPWESSSLIGEFCFMPDASGQCS